MGSEYMHMQFNPNTYNKTNKSCYSAKCNIETKTVFMYVLDTWLWTNL